MPDNKVRNQIIILFILLILLAIFGSNFVYLLGNRQLSTNSPIEYKNNQRQVGNYLFEYNLTSVDISYHFRDQALSIKIKSSISTTDNINTLYGDYVFTTNGYKQFEVFINDKKIPSTTSNTYIDAFSRDAEHNVFQNYSIQFNKYIPINQSLYTNLHVRFVYHPLIYSNHSKFVDFISGPDNLLIDFDPVVYSINLSTISEATINIITIPLLLFSFYYFNKIRVPRNFESREDIKFQLKYFPYFAITLLTTPLLKLNPFNWIHTANYTIFISNNSAFPWYILVIFESLYKFATVLILPLFIEYLRQNYVTFAEQKESLYPTPDVIEKKEVTAEDTADRQTREYLQMQYLRDVVGNNQFFYLSSIVILYMIVPFGLIIGRQVSYILLLLYYILIIRRKLPIVSTNYFNPDGSIY